MSPTAARLLRLTFAVLGTVTALIGVICLALPVVLPMVMRLPPGTPPPPPPFWGGLLYLGIAAACFYAVVRIGPRRD